MDGSDGTCKCAERCAIYVTILCIPHIGSSKNAAHAVFASPSTHEKVLLLTSQLSSDRALNEDGTIPFREFIARELELHVVDTYSVN